MTASSQQGSRWGSFFQQAVAEVESRLDDILTDGVEDTAAVQSAGNNSKTPLIVDSSQPVPSRITLTNSKSGDRLQERLARAVALKNAVPKGDNTVFSVFSRSSSPVPMQEETRSSIESVSNYQANTKADHDEATKISNLPKKINDTRVLPTAIQPTSLVQDTSSELSSSSNQECKILGELSKSELHEQIEDFSNINCSGLDAGKNPSIVSRKSADDEALSKKIHSNLSVSDTPREEETYFYLERIDTLQNKLQYMAKESAERSRLDAAAASNGSLEKKLAEKDRQIALLLDEGQALSKKELNHLATIKKLRIQLKEENKEVTEAKKKQEIAKNEAIHATERWKKMQSFEKQVHEQQKIITELQNNIKSIKLENENNVLTITNLKSHLDESISHEREAEKERMEKSLVAEQKHVAGLFDQIARLENEKKLEVSKAENKIIELEALIIINEERQRVLHLEMKTEQQILESKLEAMRAKSEEASLGATGDAQARLLRQIETLQTQYSVACENWREIEASLITRAANLEKERDEAIRKDLETRMKVRETTRKLKDTEEDLDDLRLELSISQKLISDSKIEIETLKKQVEDAEIALKEAQAAFNQEKQELKLEHQDRLAEEKQRCFEETLSNNPSIYNRPESSLFSTRKSLTHEFIGTPNSQNIMTSSNQMAREASSMSSLHNSRTSGQANRHPTGYILDSRKNSKTSLIEKLEYKPSNPSHDDFFDDFIPSPSLHPTSREMGSESTVGAGPSVQLVQRLSSAVRRLECEKVALKEEIARLSTQRDEAKAEIVKLMREIEAKKLLENRIAKLEEELHEVNKRYETSLVMLGEKSEEVDELRGDIQEIKIMYRDLVEKTVE
ncbi:hypothetical protein GcM1_228009 [Golovinomyces cichoracearum]|uniref:TATA element modulatory factor 1 TATA binding domain-containing protein n=1 Tax=Golovinomyces cichoracearum TaxID=62708 RepID=A0A420INV0_9PEZI|nr:hypothetical protein GcM1_228009 [Golovinomyces cichoracearum]